MQLNQLKAFLAAADTGSIRAAARQLGTAQPAVSASIQKLEEELGSALLQRSARGVQLTPTGTVFRERVTLVIAELERAKEEAAQMRGGGGGTVSFALSSTIALLFIGRSVRQFQRRFPDMHLNVIDATYDDAYAGLRRGSLDFSVGPMSPVVKSAELKTELLFTCPMVPVVRRKHAALGQPRRLAELMAYRWIFPSNTAGISEDTFRRHGLELPRHVRCRSLPSWLPLILENDFILLLPQIILRVPMLTELLETIDVTDPIQQANYYLFTRGDVPLTPAATALSDQFRNTARLLSRGEG